MLCHANAPGLSDEGRVLLLLSLVIALLPDVACAKPAAQMLEGQSGKAPQVCPRPDPKAAPCAVVRPTITSKLIDGTTTITGVATPTEGGKCTTTISILADENLLPLSDPANPVRTNASGGFSYEAATPLEAGQGVVVRQDISPPTDATKVDNCNLVSDTLHVGSGSSWGRVRAYFAGGVVFSREHESFSKQDLFLGLTIDDNWLWAGPNPTRLGDRIMVNTFFSARLTAAPVAVQQQTSQTATPSTTQLEQFITSQKAGVVGAGIYFPVVMTTWSFNGSPNSLFLAPLVKVGFETPTGSPPSGTQATNPDRFYTHYGYGARVGHFKMSRTRDVAPDLITYLDVIVGRFSNLDVLATESVTVNGVSSQVQFRQRWKRIAVEGLLKIPSTPFALGLSANVGLKGLSPKQNQASLVLAKDDLRIFFGTNFDIGTIFAKLKGL